MRRIMVLVTAAIVMAAMVVAMAVPAFAGVTCKETQDPYSQTCSGGTSASEPGGINNGSVGGQGGHVTNDNSANDFSGGSGGKTTVEGGGVDSAGGSGGHCEFGEPSDQCVGSAF